ncbi:transposase [Palleronia marisminoris]|uniref:Uncharacterized protein n=1 Tax=Palleronia marisminoris TaxID=315423 RepID=A0A1Y5R7A2_9RHOB|nr:transposase [Palleronia marisminoris]SLN10165.1 hypothetical protein PAM7066_00001 [Palleronia marisminoris]
MLRRQDGFRLFLDDGWVDMDTWTPTSSNAIRSPEMNRRNPLFIVYDDMGASPA